MNSQKPIDEIHPAEFRRVCARFPTGVTVVSARDEDGSVLAMTLSAFMSISLEPPLVMVSVARKANIRSLLDRVDAISISFLAENQFEVSHYFAGLLPPDMVEPFEFIEEDGHPPVIADSVGHVKAHVVRRIDAGDHRLYLAEPFEMHSPPHAPQPLAFCKGSYMELKDVRMAKIDWATEYLAVAGLP